ncbi:hypothetical protein MKEN_01174300 [Mycena kentingensis (nom. inval.)]|nr:hypothetical protein MKEN_01174300 [Mycena kentingensis (nom. inval.)]
MSTTEPTTRTTRSPTDESGMTTSTGCSTPPRTVDDDKTDDDDAMQLATPTTMTPTTTTSMETGSGRSETSPATYKGKGHGSWAMLPAELIRAAVSVAIVVFLTCCTLCGGADAAMRRRPPRTRSPPASPPILESASPSQPHIVSFSLFLRPHSSLPSRFAIPIYGAPQPVYSLPTRFLAVGARIPCVVRPFPRGDGHSPSLSHRLIATYYIKNLQQLATLPLAWTTPVCRRHPNRPERDMYIIARDLRCVDALMKVVPKWCAAIEEHDFWRTAIKALDPYNQYAAYGWVVQPHSESNSSSVSHVRVSPFRHFRAILDGCCIACRINAPGSNHGLGNARKTLQTPRLGWVSVCRDHFGPRRRRWCEVCLQDVELMRVSKRDEFRNAREELARTDAYIAESRRWLANGRGDAQEIQAAIARSLETRGDLVLQLHILQEKEEDLHRVDQQVFEVLEEDADDGGIGAGAGKVFGSAWGVCKTCRAEWVWRLAAAGSGIARDPVGMRMGRHLAQPALDWNLGLNPPPGTLTQEPARVLGLAPEMGSFCPQDRFLRDSLTMYLTFGDGSLGGVLQVAEERGWLRTQTKWLEMMGLVLATRGWDGDDGVGNLVGVGEERELERRRKQQQQQRARSMSPEDRNALAPARFEGPPDFDRMIRMDDRDSRGRAASPYDGYSDDFSDDDLDAEMAIEEEANVRDLALGDWARSRILDGSWVTPVDIFYMTAGPDHPDIGIRAIHPVRWTVSPPPSPPHQPDRETQQQAPAPSHPGVPGPSPPTLSLADAGHTAHVRQLRDVLLPPMKNVVRRLVVECALDSAEDDLNASGDSHKQKRVVDPAIRAARMSLEDVVREMREEEGVWFDGFDWSERRMNVRQAEEEAESRRILVAIAEDASSDGSGTTPGKTESPALSASTLGTTPSPPPPGELRKDQVMPPPAVSVPTQTLGSRPPVIAVDPVKNPPTMLHAIPYIPETISHLPVYSLDALRNVWREACAPLYHCRCTICVRAAREQTRAADAVLAHAQAQEQQRRAATATATANPMTGVGPGPKLVIPSMAQQQRDWADAQAVVDDEREGPLVVQIPEEEPNASEYERGVESVVSVVREGGDGADDDDYAEEDDEDDKPAYTPVELREREMIRRRYGVEQEELTRRLLAGEGMPPSLDVSEDEYDEDEDELVEVDDANAEAAYLARRQRQQTPGPGLVVEGATPTSRKRSVDELDLDSPPTQPPLEHSRRQREGSPPKRARTQEPPVIRIASKDMPPSPVKRRSEELEGAMEGYGGRGVAEDEDTASDGSGKTKRARIDA